MAAPPLSSASLPVGAAPPPVIYALRIPAILLAVVIVLLAWRAYRRGRATRGTLLFSVAIAAAVTAVAVSPSIVYTIRDRVGIADNPLSGLVVALVIVAAVQMVVLLWVLVRLDASRRILDHTFAAVAMQSLELPPGCEHSAIAVVIPALEEAGTLGAVIEAIPAVMHGAGVLAVVVDDGSRDATRQVARDAGAAVVSHPVTRGGGAALRLGYEVGSRLGAGSIVTMDADGQHDPAEMPRLVEPILAGRADLVIGSRVLGQEQGAVLTRRMGVRAFNSVISLLARRRVTDCSSGYRAFSTGAIERLRLREDQFHTGETILAAVRVHLRLEEVPITVHRRLVGESKKPGTMRYGLAFFRAMMRAWMR
ncbi:MAG TPA: glycosyltransferase family 2 protein [Acidimicrobiia bacterium]|nr:glycosyltransferase family 2 protein [Acidimicrobiia bacterium]